jgi:hypothetical protein
MGSAMVVPELNLSLSEDQAREVINRWGGRGFFRLRNMGDKIMIDGVRVGSAYTIKLRSQYEQRSVREGEVPFHGGYVDDRGQPPQPWDIPVARPPNFQERTEKITIPHSERVETCGDCHGRGQVTCGRCNGQGRISCPSCLGTGIREMPTFDMVRGPDGNAVPMTRIVRSRCVCGSGVISCTSCMGRGIQTCSNCRGSGQVKTFDQVVVRFQTATQGELLDVTPVPDGWFGRISGTVAVDLQAERIDQFEPVTPEVDKKAKELLARSHEIKESNARLLQQELRIERVPLFEVPYRYAGDQRRLWICGNEQEIYAPEAPWHRRRLMLLIGACIVAGILAAAAAVWYFWFR